MASRAFFSIAVVGGLARAGAGALAQESGDDVFVLDFEGPDVLSAAPGETASGVRGPIPGLGTDTAGYASTESWFEHSRITLPPRSHGECEGLSCLASSCG